MRAESLTVQSECPGKKKKKHIVGAQQTKKCGGLIIWPFIIFFLPKTITNVCSCLLFFFSFFYISFFSSFYYIKFIISVENKVSCLFSSVHM